LSPGFTFVWGGSCINLHNLDRSRFGSSRARGDSSFSFAACRSLALAEKEQRDGWRSIPRLVSLYLALLPSSLGCLVLSMSSRHHRRHCLPVVVVVVVVGREKLSDRFHPGHCPLIAICLSLDVASWLGQLASVSQWWTGGGGSLSPLCHTRKP